MANNEESISGTTAPVPRFDGDEAYPTDINDAGVIIGQETLEINQSGQVGEPVMVMGGDVIPIPVPPDCDFLRLTAINEAGVVAGESSACQTGGAFSRAALFADGVVTVLDAAPGAGTSTARDINDAGQVVGDPGMCADCGNPSDDRAFLYDRRSKTMHDLGTLPGHENSLAFAINNVGQVVGFAWHPYIVDVNGVGHQRINCTAYIYDHRTGVMTDLNHLIPHGSGWQLLDAAYDINDAGQIVGRGVIGGEMHAFVLTPLR